ncbi:MAG: hypothetical protein H6739_21400 [Alphaproteobacteria bacterium]|nr:hypothetical protein [Alphaproteobacteria bacterium]
MRLVGIGLMLLAAGLAWLSVGDRVSALALSVVEWEGRLGVPLWAPLGALGLAMLLFAPKRDKVLPADAPRRWRPPPPEPAAGDDWRDAVFEQAAALDFGPGVDLQVEPRGEGGYGAAAVPFTLELDRRTPEQARRAVTTFAGFLAAVPLPPRVRIRFRDCPPPEQPRAKQVTGCLRAHFPAMRFRVVGSGDRVDVMFEDADGRW